MELLKELMVLTEGKKRDGKVVVQTLKPRAKSVNDVLRTRKGGRMKADTDYDRNAVKRDTRKALAESEDDCCYWEYTCYVEYKNRGGHGDGPETYDKSEDGIVKGNTKDEAIANAKKQCSKGYDFRVSKITKAQYDNYWKD